MQEFRTNSTGSYGFMLLILLYLAAAVWMAVHLPAHATPNELLNFEYIQVMRQIKGLPNRGLVDSEVRYTEWHQPPLYFAFAAMVGLAQPVPAASTNPPPPIEWPPNPAFLTTHHGNLNPVVHVTPANTPLLFTSRYAATMLGILGLAALFRAGRDLHTAIVALLMTAILAFQPSYLHLSASVNNDMPLTAVAAMVLAYTVLIIHDDRPPVYFLGLGLLAAAAVLTKANGVFVLAYLFAAVLIVVLRHHDLKRAIKSALFALAGLIPFWAAWLILNTIRMKDTLGVEGSLPVDRVLSLRPADFALLYPWLAAIWRSFWLDWSAGGVGYGPDWYYLLWVLLLAFALMGWLRRPPERRSWPLALAILLGILSISYLYFAVKALTVKETGLLVPEGRWWLPVMPAVAWLAGAGFARWWPPERRAKAMLLATAVPIVSTYLLILIFFPSLYPQAQPLPSRTQINGESVVFDNQLAVSGTVAGDMVLGQESAVTFTWQALRDIDEDLLISAQLLVPRAGQWVKLEQQNSYPGLGHNPTAGWRAGQRYEDTWVLRPQGEVDGPTLAHLALKVAGDDGSLTGEMSGSAVDPPLVASVTVRPSQLMAPAGVLEQEVEFGELVHLAGIETEEEGGDLVVTLWWHADQPLGQDYSVFVHALDAGGGLAAQSDGRPAFGASPTTIWRSGDIIRDTHRLAGASAASSLLVGLYDPQNGERLPARAGGEALPNRAYEYILIQ
jgi:Dolichyl-phosphate-mannose-protein mannosyltransferase